MTTLVDKATAIYVVRHLDSMDLHLGAIMDALEMYDAEKTQKVRSAVAELLLTIYGEVTLPVTKGHDRQIFNRAWE
jgi:hypothetical protein